MQEYKIKLTWEAIYDVTEIADYIEEEFGVARADQFQTDIRNDFELLRIMGGYFMHTQFLFRGHSIHMKVFKPSIIFYIIDEKSQEVHILRVLREESDWENILRGKQHYAYPEER